MLLAQAETISKEALNTVTKAIEGGMVGVAIILGVAVIMSVIVIGLAIRSNGNFLMQMLQFNGRLASAVERMDTTIDKATDQAVASNTILSELAVTLSESRKEVGLMRQDFQSYATLSDDTIAGFREDINQLSSILTKKLDDMNDRLAKKKQDTQPIPAIDAPPATPPELPPTVSE